MGCRVVGIAGGEKKCSWMLEIGFDAAIDYKRPDWKHQLARATPNGIDMDFENVGGEIMDAVLERLSPRARVVICGLISGYNGDAAPKGNFTALLMKRARAEGFIVSDYRRQWEAATAQLMRWVVDGQIKHRETVVEGLERAPEALNMLFDGVNIGKLVLKI